jgi:hypothetical protein
MTRRELITLHVMPICGPPQVYEPNRVERVGALWHGWARNDGFYLESVRYGDLPHEH